ncbi:ABC transporter ATP-binding protein [Microlunatus parietis]|uniref:Oligopeptide/dipeptide ABC transporter ATP-binding protein n=1 Tax=Microlunatus parietis TaxID=682979 RepID=A0A7Y9ICV5_9ACTN|nr:ABC transporter ATP-binding protein [Microlunatus parietis]NYE74480.1 oligopeptide/dipeptide ABC transporter ATP-binding protein [Microlunatus parietis]
MNSPMTAELLTVSDLAVEFRTEDGTVYAVDGISFQVRTGELLAIVGESGSGKSVTALSVVGLLDRKATVTGSIALEGEELTTASEQRMQSVRGGRIGMIFQDPMTALNPVMTIGAQLAEAIRLHAGKGSRAALDKAAVRERCIGLLESVGVANPDQRLRQYPHEFSGGMRQRAMIAMAIANDPDLIIADEPTTALDVTIQAQVLDQLRKAQRETGAAAILITHDLGVVAELADRVIVMYAGRIVESAGVRELFRQPRHPYTMGLLASLPTLDSELTRLHPIPGSPPDVSQPISNCPFHPRCPLAVDRCRTEDPGLVEVDGGHLAACFRTDELIGRTPEQVFVRTVVEVEQPDEPAAAAEAR